MSQLGTEHVGKEVLCPKCGQIGKIVVITSYAKGYKYTYLAIEHDIKYKDGKTKKKCVIKMISREKAEKRQISQPRMEKPLDTYMASTSLVSFLQEKQRLMDEIERLKRENEALKDVIYRLKNSVIAVASEKDRLGIYLAKVKKVSVNEKYASKYGLTVEELDQLVERGNKIVATLASSEDWVAVKRSEFDKIAKVVS
jgi:hypothetical protein